ncbi:MAG: type II secretion system protein [Verrucomicrobiota bacterium]
MKQEMKKSGFTLVEIMIVVAIIGLLAAIGIPSFQKARDTSRSKACVNNLRMIAAGTEQHMMDNNVTSATLAEACAYIKSGEPDCPAQGTYTVGTETTDPTCSLGGDHALVVAVVP